MTIISPSRKTQISKTILAIRKKKLANNISGTKICEFCAPISSKQFTLCKNPPKLEMIVFFLKWQQEQEKLLFPPPSSNYFCEQATPKEFCFWLIVWNWKTKPTKILSAIWAMIFLLLSTSKTATTGKRRKLSFPQFKVFRRKINTKNFSHRPTLIWLLPMNHTEQSAETRELFLNTLSATN